MTHQYGQHADGATSDDATSADGATSECTVIPLHATTNAYECSRLNFGFGTTVLIVISSQVGTLIDAQQKKVDIYCSVQFKCVKQL